MLQRYNCSQVRDVKCSSPSFWRTLWSALAFLSNSSLQLWGILVSWKTNKETARASFIAIDEKNHGNLIKSYFNDRKEILMMAVAWIFFIVQKAGTWGHVGYFLQWKHSGDLQVVAVTWATGSPEWAKQTFHNRTDSSLSGQIPWRYQLYRCLSTQGRKSLVLFQ